MVKASDIYLEQFARLGVFSKVEALASAPASLASSDSENACATGKFSMHFEQYFCIYYRKLHSLM